MHPGIERLHKLSRKVDYQKLIFPGIVILIGFARFLQGMANEKPVGYLVLEMGIYSFLSLLILNSYSYTTSVRECLNTYWMEQNNKGYGNNIINNFTILGAAAIAGFAEYPVLKTVFGSVTPEHRSFGSTDSAGCGSGGGSSCGSGCSGCGGCGGD